MEKQYIIGIDQSTQGTKALLFDEYGNLLQRADLLHQQIVNEKGWVEHNPIEIYNNTLTVVKSVVESSGIEKDQVVGIAISNQRETVLIWDRESGVPVYNAIVWQCARAESICTKISESGMGELIYQNTGLKLSPYFSAAKIAWIIDNVVGVKEKMMLGQLCIGTIDTWLIYKLTNGKEFKTEYSNASRTQLFNINKLTWDAKICELFHVNPECLPTVCDSNTRFGETKFAGYFNHPIAIHGVMGDSHGALYGQGCHKSGMVKVTYGTGSSIMMNIGETPVVSQNGLVTSLAWGLNGKVDYVLEGNINYTGAVISWLVKEMQLVQSASETEELAKQANIQDRVYLVPAFTGLSAPYWDSNAKASISGMSRTTGKNEIVKAALDSIAYQIEDVVRAMSMDTGIRLQELRVDGGPTKNGYLMQFQSDITNGRVKVPNVEELSAIGVAYVAGIALGIYTEEVFNRIIRTEFVPNMPEEERVEKIKGWKQAVSHVLS